MKKSSALYGICACFMICAFLQAPASMLAASQESIRLWLTGVFPSLFPFMTACGILLRTGAAERIGRLLHPLMHPLFGLSGIAAFPFFLGILSGYPTGAKITAQLYKNGQIDQAQAQQILLFSNNPGVIFLVCTIGAGFFGMPLWGYLLLASVLLSSVATAFIRKFCRKNPPSFPQISCPPLLQTSRSEILSSAVSDAVNTIFLIGGYLILFGTFSEAMKQTGLFHALSEILFFLPLSAGSLQGICSGMLEMTNGAYLMSQSPDSLRLRLTLIAFLVSFGGLSICGQTFGILASVPIRKKDYIKGKLINALCCSLVLYFLFPFFEQNAQKAVPVCFLPTETAFTLSFLWSLPSLFLLGSLCHLLICRK